ncbi:hypothetical protein NHJ13734_005551 [Beauveria thailandica]
MRECRANWTFLTPSVARTLRPCAVPDLGVLVIGGESARAADFRTWSGALRLLYVYGPAECSIHSTVQIIYNGAVVNWHMDYDSLRSANVLATIELLKAATLSRSSPRFVFVSGGIMADLDTSPGNTMVAEQLGRSNGYSQSKFVAEAIVRRFASQLPSAQNRFSVIKPGMIIRTADKGVANVDDFIWRVVATASRLQLFPLDAKESWVPISDADFVALQTVNQILSDDISPSVNIATTFGLGASDFWEQVNAELKTCMQASPMVRLGRACPLEHKIKVAKAIRFGRCKTF